MSLIRNWIENWYAQLARTLFRNRIKTIVIVLHVTAAIVSQIPKITIETSMEGFPHEDDPAMLAYNAFRDQFGRDEVVLVALQPPDVFEVSENESSGRSGS